MIMNIRPDYIERSCRLALAAAVMAFTGCTGDADIFENGVRPSDCLAFTASIESVETRSFSRSSVSNLETVEERWALQTMPGGGSSTRGSLATYLSGEAGVMGFTYDTGETEKTPLDIDDNNIAFEFNGDELTAVGAPIRWNSIGKTHLDIHAYAPMTSDGLEVVDPGTAPALAYTVPDAVADQRDIIVSTWHSPDSDYRNKTIHLAFDHALTAVRFKVGFECTVKSVTIEGVHNSGTYGFSTNEWICGDSKASYTVDFGEEGKTFTKDDLKTKMLTDGGNTMILLPQALPQNAKIVLTCTDREYTAEIGGRVWEPGKLVTYTLYKDKAPATIYFDLALADVFINGNTYSGKRKINGAEETVSGAHTSGNHYYVYQSTPENIDLIWQDGVFNSPPYGEVKGPDGRSWREYITNNPDVDEVINAWSSKVYNQNSPGSDDLAKAAGRSGTNHRIDIIGDVTCELTIDNIYSTYQQSSNPTNRTMAGIVFMPIRNNRNVKNAKVTVNMLGDSRVGAVHYSNWPDNGNEIIFEGTGSLTVADVDGNIINGTSDSSSPIGIESGKGYWSNHWSSAIGGNDSSEEMSYGIVINSGIIFAGTTKAENCTAIGGGGNQYGKVTINGGTVTAVATTTGTSIGGGIGFGSPGGKGEVKITGGNVYAYNHANRWGVPSSSIGGAGSKTNYGELGIVEISGGYVYAESALGTAIGGGSSWGKKGGDAVVKITGGEVIARTLSKNNASIGGGTAYSQVGSSSGFNGGHATITISGDPIIRTGSIGGGGTGDSNGYKGNATINISGGDIQAQFILAAGTGAGQIPSFTMTGGMIRNSNTRDEEYLHMEHKGGAVYLENGAVTISGGTIKNCSADTGGAIFIKGDGKSSNASFTMTGGTIKDNESDSDGGAVCIQDGTVSISGGTIDDNLAAGGNGGGIFIQRGSLTMGGSATIQNNSAEIRANDSGEIIGGNGGGIYALSRVADIEIELSSGTITRNTADRKGGGVCVDMQNSDYTADVAIGTASGGNIRITENHALVEGGGLYARGANAHITIDSGMIMDNTVSQYVYNQNVANEQGTVVLNGGEVTHNVVTFDANGGQETEPSYQNIVTSTNSKLVTPVFHRTGYNLVGWNTKRNGTGKSYTDGEEMNINTNIILYAQWAIAVTR